MRCPMAQFVELSLSRTLFPWFVFLTKRWTRCLRLGIMKCGTSSPLCYGKRGFAGPGVGLLGECVNGMDVDVGEMFESYGAEGVDLSCSGSRPVLGSSPPPSSPSSSSSSYTLRLNFCLAIQAEQSCGGGATSAARSASHSCPLAVRSR